MTSSRKFENVIYLSASINSFGSWCTVLGLALLVQQKHGGTALAFSLIVQSLPMIAFSRKVAERFNTFNLIPLWCILQLISAVNVIFLSFSQSLISVFIYMLISSTAGCIASSASRAIIGTYVEKEKIASVFQKSGALTSSLIVLSPIVGAYLSSFFGLNALFLIDALSFVLAAGILYLNRSAIPFIGSNESINKVPFKIFEVIAEACRSFIDTISLNSKLKSKPSELFCRSSQNWYCFLIIGALINGLEYSLFAKYEFSTQLVAFTLSAWGVGNLIALILPIRFLSFLDVGRLSFFYSACLALVFIISNAWSVVFCFGLAGFFCAILAGALKAQLQSSQPADVSALEIWAYLGQRTGIINIIVYLICAVLLMGNFNIARIMFCVFILVGINIDTFYSFIKRNAK